MSSRHSSSNLPGEEAQGRGGHVRGGPGSAVSLLTPLARPASLARVHAPVDERVERREEVVVGVVACRGDGRRGRRSSRGGSRRRGERRAAADMQGVRADSAGASSGAGSCGRCQVTRCCSSGRGGPVRLVAVGSCHGTRGVSSGGGNACRCSSPGAGRPGGTSVSARLRARRCSTVAEDASCGEAVHEHL